MPKRSHPRAGSTKRPSTHRPNMLTARCSGPACRNADAERRHGSASAAVLTLAAGARQHPRVLGGADEDGDHQANTTRLAAMSTVVARVPPPDRRTRGQRAQDAGRGLGDDRLELRGERDGLDRRGAEALGARARPAVVAARKLEARSSRVRAPSGRRRSDARSRSSRCAPPRGMLASGPRRVPNAASTCQPGGRRRKATAAAPGRRNNASAGSAAPGGPATQVTISAARSSRAISP